MYTLQIRILLLVVAISFFTNVNANHVLYSLEYLGSSKNAPSFANGQITGQVFRSGNPAGYFKSTLNSSSQFSIPNDRGNIAIAVLSIKDSKNKNLKCSGNGLPGSRKITIKCYR